MGVRGGEVESVTISSLFLSWRHGRKPALAPLYCLVVLSGFAICYIAIHFCVAQAPEDLEAFRQAVPMPVFQAQVAAFTAVMVLNIINVAFSRDNLRFSCNWLLVLVNTLALTTHLLVELDLTPVVLGPTGLFFHPLRYCCWLFSTPTLLILLSFLSDLSPRQVLLAVGSDAVMILTGLAAVWTAAYAQLFYTIISCVAFVPVLWYMKSMFDSAISATEEPLTRFSLRVLLWTCMLVWSAFPAVWLLAFCHIITPEQEQIGLALCDFVAKAVFSSQLWQGNVMTIQQRSDKALRAWQESNSILIMHKLRKLLSARDVLVHSLSHELRTPIKGIVALTTDLMKAVDGGPSNGKAQDSPGLNRANLSMIRSSAVCLLDIISSALDAVRNPVTQQPMTGEVVRLRSLAEGVVQLVGPLLPRHIQLTNEVPRDLPSVDSNRRALMRVLLNMTGALTQSPLVHGRIALRAHQLDGCVVVQVTAIDVVLEDDCLQRLMYPFSPGSGAIMPDMTGDTVASNPPLFLFLLRNFLDVHAPLSAAADPDTGTTFSFRLPIADYDEGSVSSLQLSDLILPSDGDLTLVEEVQNILESNASPREGNVSNEHRGQGEQGESVGQQTGERPQTGSWDGREGGGNGREARVGGGEQDALGRGSPQFYRKNAVEQAPATEVPQAAVLHEQLPQEAQQAEQVRLMQQACQADTTQQADMTQQAPAAQPYMVQHAQQTDQMQQADAAQLIPAPVCRDGPTAATNSLPQTETQDSPQVARRNASQIAPQDSSPVSSQDAALESALQTVPQVAPQVASQSLPQEQTNLQFLGKTEQQAFEQGNSLALAETKLQPSDLNKSSMSEPPKPQTIDQTESQPQSQAPTEPAGSDASTAVSQPAAQTLDTYPALLWRRVSSAGQLRRSLELVVVNVRRSLEAMIGHPAALKDQDSLTTEGPPQAQAGVSAAKGDGRTRGVHSDRPEAKAAAASHSRLASGARDMVADGRTEGANSRQGLGAGRRSSMDIQRGSLDIRRSSVDRQRLSLSKWAPERRSTERRSLEQKDGEGCSSHTSDGIHPFWKAANSKMLHRHKHGVVQVLSVDDNVINQLIAEAVLKGQHWRVVKAMSGEQALDYLLNKAEVLPDMLLLDLMMPGINGFDVCSRVREFYPSSVLPIMMLTTSMSESNIVEGLQRGADDYVAKPYKRMELTSRIRAHLRARDDIHDLHAHLSAWQLQHNLLPPEVRAKLLAGHSIVPERVEAAVLVVHVCDLAAESALVAPSMLVAMLNQLLAAFVQICTKHHAQLVDFDGSGCTVLQVLDETIGGGGKTLQDMVKIGSEMLDAARPLKWPSSQPLRLQVALHKGPLTVGMLGQQVLKYTLLGEAFTVAEQLAQAAAPCSMLVSSAVVDKCPDTSIFLHCPAAPEPVLWPSLDSYLVKTHGWEAIARPVASSTRSPRTPTLSLSVSSPSFLSPSARPPAMSPPKQSLALTLVQSAPLFTLQEVPEKMMPREAPDVIRLQEASTISPSQQVDVMSPVQGASAVASLQQVVAAPHVQRASAVSPPQQALATSLSRSEPMNVMLVGASMENQVSYSPRSSQAAQGLAKQTPTSWAGSPVSPVMVPVSISSIESPQDAAFLSGSTSILCSIPGKRSLLGPDSILDTRLIPDSGAHPCTKPGSSTLPDTTTATGIASTPADTLQTDLAAETPGFALPAQAPLQPQLNHSDNIPGTDSLSSVLETAMGLSVSDATRLLGSSPLADLVHLAPFTATPATTAGPISGPPAAPGNFTPAHSAQIAQHGIPHHPSHSQLAQPARAVGHPTAIAAAAAAVDIPTTEQPAHPAVPSNLAHAQMGQLVQTLLQQQIGAVRRQLQQLSLDLQQINSVLATGAVAGNAPEPSSVLPLLFTPQGTLFSQDPAQLADAQTSQLEVQLQQPSQSGMQLQQSLQLGMLLQQLLQSGMQSQQSLQSGMLLQQSLQPGMQAQQSLQSGVQLQQMLRSGAQLQQWLQSGVQSQQQMQQGTQQQREDAQQQPLLSSVEQTMPSKQMPLSSNIVPAEEFQFTSELQQVPPAIDPVLTKELAPSSNALRAPSSLQHELSSVSGLTGTDAANVELDTRAGGVSTPSKSTDNTARSNGNGLDGRTSRLSARSTGWSGGRTNDTSTEPTSTGMLVGAVSIATRTSGVPHGEDDATVAAAMEADNAAVSSDNATVTTDNAAFSDHNAAVSADNAAVSIHNAAVSADNAAVFADNAVVLADNATVSADNAEVTARNGPSGDSHGSGGTCGVVGNALNSTVSYMLPTPTRPLAQVSTPAQMSLEQLQNRFLLATATVVPRPLGPATRPPGRTEVSPLPFVQQLQDPSLSAPPALAPRLRGTASAPSASTEIPATQQCLQQPQDRCWSATPNAVPGPASTATAPASIQDIAGMPIAPYRQDCFLPANPIIRPRLPTTATATPLSTMDGIMLPALCTACSAPASAACTGVTAAPCVDTLAVCHANTTHHLHAGTTASPHSSTPVAEHDFGVQWPGVQSTLAPMTTTSPCKPSRPGSPPINTASSPTHHTPLRPILSAPVTAGLAPRRFRLSPQSPQSEFAFGAQILAYCAAPATFSEEAEENEPSFAGSVHGGSWAEFEIESPRSTLLGAGSEFEIESPRSTLLGAGSDGEEGVSSTRTSFESVRTGFDCVETTSGGFAASLGGMDRCVFEGRDVQQGRDVEQRADGQKGTAAGIRVGCPDQDGIVDMRGDASRKVSS